MVEQLVEARTAVERELWGPFSVAGRTALVTGGAKGIGHGIVNRLAEGGANILIADLDGPA
ncbi:MAG: SDR family NAD(P)-dependent oxidoreductase, partial [Candidatus Dormibacteraeota bacterium]|nr:SDR family NAD(P)-dependent oxidoreductase [Candidatus Dormibacteraeota bacterium]